MKETHTLDLQPSKKQQKEESAKMLTPLKRRPLHMEQTPAATRR